MNDEIMEQTADASTEAFELVTLALTTALRGVAAERQDARVTGMDALGVVVGAATALHVFAEYTGGPEATAIFHRAVAEVTKDAMAGSESFRALADAAKALQKFDDVWQDKR